MRLLNAMQRQLQRRGVLVADIDAMLVPAAISGAAVRRWR
jgi:hypothetical protein